PNSWHLQARIKSIAGNELDGGDHIYADLHVKENTARNFLPLGTYLESQRGESSDAIGDDLGTNVDLNEYGNLLRALMPSISNSTLPCLILPVGTTFKDTYEAIIAGIASSEEFINLFGTWAEFSELIRWTPTMSNNCIYVEFDLFPLLKLLPSGIIFTAFPYLLNIVELVENTLLEFDINAITCYLTISYNASGILNKIDLDVHVQGAIKHGTEHGSFVIYFEFITLAGELPLIVFKHVPFISAEYLIALPLVAGSACVSIAMLFLVRKTIVKRRDHASRTRKVFP
ncbi:MAG: hypothetical protein Q6370_020835, partial [Candidatus Sigynarchaeota archaeon]